MTDAGNDDPLLASLLAAAAAAPEDVPLRLHVAEQLAQRGRHTEALRHCAEALARDAANPVAAALLRSLTIRLTGEVAPPGPRPESGEVAPPGPRPESGEIPAASGGSPAESGEDSPGFDWDRAEQQVRDIDAGATRPSAAEEPDGAPPVEDIERPAVRLVDVAGMDHVKQRLELAVLAPMRNPRLARAFGSTGAGGLLLYGPPGCGKTFLARAVAGELGARFLNVGISDVLDMWTGASERNVTEIFRAARRNAPCVLFLDEIDALGQKRSHLRYASGMRNTVNQLLTEMDSAGGGNDGVFVLGATNHPWDVDSALRRPGRFDRMLLVLPPDAAARAAVLRYHLRDRPVGNLDIERLVRVTEHFSGADLAHLCTTAAEQALAATLAAGQLRPLTTADLEAALSEIRPSTGPWFATARNVVAFANTDGSYDELAAYLKKYRPR